MTPSRVAYSLMLTATALSMGNGQTRLYPSTRSQYETHLAVNPTNPANIIAVAITEPFATDRKIGAYYSMDGGVSWSGNDSVSAVSVRCADPVVLFDPAGRAYCIYQSFDVRTLYCQKSTDGGISWGSVVTILEGEEPIDRPWAAVSPIPNAQGYFDIYVLISEDLSEVNGRVNMVLSKSTNGAGSFGVIHSFTAASTKYQGATVGVGPDGAVWAGFARLNASGTGWPVTDIFVHQSTNGGSSFSQSVSWTTTQIGDPGGDWKNHYIKNGQIRVESFPRLAVDNSISSNRGTVYIAWSNKNGFDGSADLMVMKKPAGQSWTGAGSIVSSGDQFAPAVAVGPDGSWSLLYYEIGLGQDQVHVRHTVRKPDGTITNDVHVGKSPTFEITSSYRPFIGDYIGVALWYGKSYGVWTEARGNVSGGETQQQAYFGALTTQEVLPSGYVKTNVTQVGSQDDPFGKVGKYAVNQFIGYKAPYDFRWEFTPPNNSQTLRADQGWKPGSSEKYWSWRNEPDVINHRTFIIRSWTSQLIAEFRQAYDATVRSRLIETGAYGGSLFFRDPWFPNDYSDGKGVPQNKGLLPNAFPVSYSPNNVGVSSNFKGVLLNQGIPEVLQPPFYSVVTAPSQTLGGFAANFQSWEDNNSQIVYPNQILAGYYETPVVFRTTGVHTVTANYKAHRASNSSSVLDAQGQRRYVMGGSNPDQMLVYESAGDIWSTYRVGGGLWSAEKRLSATGNASKPSTHWWSAYQPAVWQAGSGSNYAVAFSKRSSGTWLTTPVSIATGLSLEPRPVVGFKSFSSLPAYPVVAYRESASNVRLTWSGDGGTTWTGSSNFTASSPVDQLSLSVVHDALDYQNSVLTLAYDGPGVIRFRDFQGSWGSEQVIEASGPVSYIGYGMELTMNHSHSPQVVRKDGWTYFSWNQYQEYTDGYWWIVPQWKATIARQPSGDWGTATVFECYNMAPPSITTSGNTLALSWYDESVNSVMLARAPNGVWDYAEPVAGGKQNPQLVTSGGGAPSSIKYVPQEPVGSLFKMDPGDAPAMRTLASSGPTKSSAHNSTLPWNYSRVVSVFDTASGAVFSAIVSEATVGGRKIALKAVNDTLPGIDVGNFFEFLSTEEFSGSSADTVLFDISFHASGWPKTAGSVVTSLGLDDESTNEPLGALGSSQLNLTKATGRITVRRVLGGLANRALKINLEAELPLQNGVAILTHVYRLPKKVTPQVQTPSEAAPITETGEDLLTAYPNPFNPETRIGYRIEETGWVKVALYDLLGREVAVLVEGEKPAGTYSAVWNAQGLPSGTYLCRLTVQEPGEKNIVRVAKLQYVR